MKRTFAALVVMAAVQVAVPVGLAEASVDDRRPDTEILQRDADALLKQGAPGVLVEVDTPEGNAKVRSGFGDVQAKEPVPWNAKFRVGSYTKTFVATTLLQLVGEGKLSLEDTVEKWLPGVVAGNGNDGSRITVRQLLQHTSGLPDYVQELKFVFNQEEFEKNRFTTVTPEESVRLAMKHKPTFPPGAGWGYSNTNFVLAGMIIEEITGNSWQHETHRRIIAPLGLRDTYAPGEFPFVLDPHAIGYERFPLTDPIEDPDPEFGPPIDATTLNPSWGGAAGEIVSSTADANKFLRALIGGEVLRPAELAEMQKTVRAKAFDVAWPGARYGLGLMWFPSECGGVWSHGGDIPGFMTRNGITEDGTRSVVVSVNTDSMIPDEGTPPPKQDVTHDLVNHALCGTR